MSQTPPENPRQSQFRKGDRVETTARKVRGEGTVACVENPKGGDGRPVVFVRMDGYEDQLALFFPNTLRLLGVVDRLADLAESQ